MAIVRQRVSNTPRAIQPVVFSDFTTNLDVIEYKNDLVRETNENAVKTSIKNLLLTNRGDRLFNNTLGSDIRAILFENTSPAMEQILSDYITKTIENYEPRAGIISITVNSEIDEHSVGVTIIFRIINREEPVMLELVLNRIR